MRFADSDHVKKLLLKYQNEEMNTNARSSPARNDNSYVGTPTQQQTGAKLRGAARQSLNIYFGSQIKERKHTVKPVSTNISQQFNKNSNPLSLNSSMYELDKSNANFPALDLSKLASQQEVMDYLETDRSKQAETNYIKMRATNQSGLSRSSDLKDCLRAMASTKRTKKSKSKTPYDKKLASQNQKVRNGVGSRLSSHNSSSIGNALSRQRNYEMDKTMSIVEVSGTHSNTQSKTRKSKNKRQSPFSPPRADSENATPW